MSKQPLPHQHQRGEIADNALAALVTDPLFRNRIEQNRKGKGSYRRHAKHKTGEWSAQLSLAA
ncbi:ribosome alternative rescue factor ArfA [Pseudaeromonas paramecii]|uniref:Ribosome alternative rescue factor ArfA n=1 Tax=Pseudaeromonas paramecii TaxID=2138166 RepID=A0ABP8PWY3_9GAMM